MGPIIDTGIAAVAALAGGLALATTGLLQQHEARLRPPREHGSWRLLVSLMRDRWWRVGIVAAAVAYGFQALALSFGPLALVQPLLVSELLFAVPVSVRLRGLRLHAREWFAVASVITGLTLGIVAAYPQGGRPLQPFGEWAYVLGAAGLAGVAGLLTARFVAGPAKASLIAFTASVWLGLQSAVYATTLALLGHAGWDTFLRWQPYTLIVLSVLGGFLVQNAYQAGPLAASMPVMDVTIPVVSISIGILLFDETARTSALALAGVAAGLALLITGIVLLDTSPVVRREQGMQTRDQTEQHP